MAERGVRHGRLRRPSGTRWVLQLVAAVAAVIAVSGTSLVAIAAANIGGNVADNAVDLGVVPTNQAPQLGAIEGAFTVLVVGTDNDAAQGDQYGAREGVRNDVTIVLHVSADHSSATVVSFPRDLIVDRPECTDPETGVVSEAETDVSLNTAFENGGLACVNNTIQQFTGLSIPYAGWVSFNGVIALSNAVGGVPICLTGPILDTDSGLDLPAGTTTVSGSMALAFLRSRHGVGDESDLARISSQQQYLASLMRTMRSSDTLSDIPTLYGLAQAASSNVHLSTSLTSPATMISLALALKDIDLARMVCPRRLPRRSRHPARPQPTKRARCPRSEPPARASGGEQRPDTTEGPPAYGRALCAGAAQPLIGSRMPFTVSSVARNSWTAGSWNA
ncbi:MULTISPECIES: LCP family protein [unclassified Rathayibacter]|uniref:LCP family protein n=1 Tax=unclassified Rathayibacter TaxID=2609250 RepID=UPI00188C6A4B|nr:MULTISPECIES: LCP family protein [unclassified Rathayibacter]MBF4461122.1 LCP family protein [Rathayibacter sp. VKM Ac-2879]MBF4502533.1 LCP family protein [Rathayibacter sp. VKM Ac-2878]